MIKNFFSSKNETRASTTKNSQSFEPKIVKIGSVVKEQWRAQNYVTDERTNERIDERTAEKFLTMWRQTRDKLVLASVALASRVKTKNGIFSIFGAPYRGGGRRWNFHKCQCQPLLNILHQYGPLWSNFQKPPRIFKKESRTLVDFAADLTVLISPNDMFRSKQTSNVNVIMWQGTVIITYPGFVLGQQDLVGPEALECKIYQRMCLLELTSQASRWRRIWAQRARPQYRGGLGSPNYY